MANGFVGRAGEVERIRRLYSAGHVRGVSISGPPGVGTTRLGLEVARGLADDAATIRAAGSTGASGIPFGAVAGWIPNAMAAENSLQVLVSAKQALANRAGAGRLLAIIDDAHLLDACSATLVAQVAEAGIAFLILSHRSGAALPDPIRALLKNDQLGVIELGPLDAAAVEEYVSITLDGPIDRVSAATINRLSQGIPLYVGELAAEAAARGAVELRDNVWALTGFPPISSRLGQALRNELDALAASELAALELIAAGEPIGFDVIESTVDDAVLESLERQGIVVADRAGRRTSIRVSSPLLAAMVRDSLPASRLRRLAGILADARAAGAHRRDDVVRLSDWKLAAGRETTPAELIDAARQALAKYDAWLAERFARSAHDGGGGLEADLQLAEALALQDKGPAANEVLARANRQVATETDRVSVAIAQVRCLVYLGGSIIAALDAGFEALSQLDDPDSSAALAAELSVFAALMGDYSRATVFAERIVDGADAGESVVVGKLLVSAIGDVMLGRLDAAAEAARRGLQLAPRVADRIPLVADLFKMHLQHGRMLAGDLAAVERECRAAYADAIREERVAGYGLWAAHLAAAMAFRGDLLGAGLMYAEAAGHLDGLDPLQALPVTQSWRALILAESGQIQQSEHVVAMIDPEHLPGEFRIRALLERVRAWKLAHNNELRAAAEISIAAGRALIEHSHVMWGLLALHDAVRFGHGQLVAAELDAWADVVDGEMAPLLARHAEAQAAADGAALDACAADFERLGALLWAAETASQASSAHSSAGSRSRAARSSGSAEGLLHRCGAVRTPALRSEVKFLTERELEVATAAARGRSNREIATELYISRRTVENHLGSVYAKLGIAGREELVRALGADGRRLRAV